MDDAWTLTLTLAYTSRPVAGDTDGTPYVYFESDDQQTTVTMSDDRWDMLGRPDVLTVSLMAGPVPAARSYASV